MHFVEFFFISFENSLSTSKRKKKIVQRNIFSRFYSRDLNQVALTFRMYGDNEFRKDENKTKQSRKKWHPT